MNDIKQKSCSTLKGIFQIRTVHKLVLVFAIAFVINLIWENAQAPLYQGYESFTQHFQLCFNATFFDAFFVLVMYGLFTLLRKNFFTVFLVLLAFVSFGTAYIIEIRALSSGKWLYTASMPLVFEVGLSPFVQLFVTSVISIYIVQKVVSHVILS